MANVNAAATVWNCPNYIGELFLIGANQTAFLNMAGGLSEGGKVTTSPAFPISQPWALEAPAQPAITETDSLTAPTAWTYVRGQDVNTTQIFHRAVSVSYAKQSATGQIVPLSATQSMQQGAVQPVTNELDFQIEGHMAQIAMDVDYTFLNGAYALATSAAVAAKTRGIITAATTNTVDASAAALTRTLFNSLLVEMATNGARFTNPVIFVNAFQKQQITNVFGYAPSDRNIGGLNVKQLETDFATFGVIWAPNVPAGTLLIADMAYVSPVFLPVPGKGVLFYEDLGKTGASEGGQIYGQIGLDYGPEEFHGTLTNLATA